MEEVNEATLILLKFLGLLLPPLATTLALLVEYKTPEKKLTIWGRRAIGLTIATAFVSALSFTLEQRRTRISTEKAAKNAEAATALLERSAEEATNASRQSSTAAAKSAIAADASRRGSQLATEQLSKTDSILSQTTNQLKKTDAVLAQADRSLRRLEFADLSILFTVDVTHKSIYEPYIARLRSAIVNVPKDAAVSVLGRGYWESGQPKGGVVVGIDGVATIYPSSGLFPVREGKELYSWDNLHNYEYVLRLYRSPGIDLRQLATRENEQIVQRLRYPDLLISFVGTFADDEHLRLVFDPGKSRLHVVGKQLRRSRSDWNGNGKLPSEGDLADAQIILEVKNTGIRKGNDLQVLLNLSNMFELDQEDFKPVPGTNNFYAFKFPTHGDGLRFRQEKAERQESIEKERDLKAAEEYRHLREGQWCSLSETSVSNYVQGAGDAEEQREMCRVDVRAGGGRAPVGATTIDSLYGMLQWEHPVANRSEAIGCWCRVGRDKTALSGALADGLPPG